MGDRPVVARLIAWVRPSAAGAAELSDWRYIVVLTQRGLRKAVRGTLSLALLPRVEAPFFRGRGVVIRSGGSLHAGAGFHIGDYSLLDCHGAGPVKIGVGVTIRERAWLQVTSTLADPGQGVTIGDRTYIGPGSVLGGGGALVIGSNCQVGANVCFSTERHVIDGDSIFGSGVERTGIRIGNDVWVGNGAHILDGVSVGHGAVIGAGAVVTRDVGAYEVVAGVPATVIRHRTPPPPGAA